MKSIHINNNHPSTLTSIRNHMLEYLLIFSCDEVTKAHITSVKEFFERRYGCKFAANLTPHMALMQCIIHESKVDRVVQGCKKVAETSAPFKMELNGFDKYDRGTMYVDVAAPASGKILEIVKNLKTDIDKHIQQWSPAEHEYCTDPHYTIARNMTEKQLDQAWFEWRYQQFSANFQVNEMQLLRRSLVKGDKFQIVERFPLKGLPSAQFVQAALF
ncbi:hypothetical protein DYBT9623_00903 [Dyadobacter sp. CECT 9623]|uniref:2'-5' RNA ligase family protein n=1 Tax=Dyadobacter linearis TaxID=2823330 RepID=A0ABN7R7S4_9BACT|nr:2'-5' RNA ligase family protein [Dyadobacter sp. CECT 9623]CAG5068174.1 hypothetical protein DYBT9623_00903 [Dyadobacter sp. CECT 9623]